MSTLAERFARDRGAPQEIDGVVVHNIYRRKVVKGERVRIRRVRAVPGPPQGLRLKIDRGSVLINGQELKDAVLWAETAPPEVEVICKPQTAGGELRIWNCWKDSEGIMQAWLGDAGMVIEERGNRTLLRCGAGFHPFSPTDLEVEVEFG